MKICRQYLGFYFFISICFFCCTESLAEMKIDFYPQGDIQQNPVSLVFNGKIYTESWWVDEIAKGIFITSDDEKFIIKVINTYQTGTSQDVLNLWAPAERDAMKSTISDAAMFAGSKSFYKKTQMSAFMVKVLYGSYTIFLIQHSGNEIGNTILEYPIVKIDNSYYLTNKLEADPIYTYITDKLSASLKYKQR